jgi:Cu(I)/Ag(I) efflux system membrane fusion protein
MKYYIRTLSLLAVLATGTSLLAHSDAFTPAFVDTLVTPYLTIQTALASDDLKAAQAGAEAFMEATKKAPKAEDAQAEAAELHGLAEKIATAEDLKSARVAFLPLSTDLTSMVKHVGVSDKQPLYAANCPMAFSGKGGGWIQSDKTIANPYYGSKMLRCGSVKSQLAGEEETDHHKKSPEKKTHSGHHH